MIVLLILSVMFGTYLNQKNYNEYYSKTLLRLHTDTKISAMTEDLPQRIAFLLMQGDAANLQKLLDSNYALLGLVITDCTAETKECPEQRILYSTNPKLIPDIAVTPAELSEYPYTLLRKPSPAELKSLEQTSPGIQRLLTSPKEEVIGRLYSISTIPSSFPTDYRAWLKHPFRDKSPWKEYRRTMAACLLAGFLVSVVIELFLKLRRMERQGAAQRERVLISNADSYLHQLEEKEAQIKEQEERIDRQFGVYIGRIKELEQKLRLDAVHQQETEAIISELEAEKEEQTLKFREQLEKTNQERLSLREELERFKRAAQKDKEEASRALESVIGAQFANSFERNVFERLGKCAKSRAGHWIPLAHFDVAVGRGGSQFVDSILISRECLVVVEAKNYLGTIAPDGDAENAGWLCLDRENRSVAIRSNWGKNPYHQVREYTMNLMRLVQGRGSWNMPVYGVVVFPEGADVSRTGERIGKYYRVTTGDRLVVVLENIEAEARRENAHTRRPSPRQVENLLRGRSDGGGFQKAD